MKDINMQCFDVLMQASSSERVKNQTNSSKLLFEKNLDFEDDGKNNNDSLYNKLRQALSESTQIFKLSPIQQDIYHIDSGTAFIPKRINSILLDINSKFLIRPVTLDDLKKFVQLAFKEKIRYTIRGAGTWPFGGSIPMNDDVIVDLAYLDFYELNEDREQLLAGPGVVFGVLRSYLWDRGFSFFQDITNPNSGTLCGWIATGGYGIGAYKYGHVKNSILSLLLLKPDGEFITVTPEDELFNILPGSEGQLGIIAGVMLKVRRMNFISKPYAISFTSVESVIKFFNFIKEYELKPSSMIYFDEYYIQKTYEVEKEKTQKELEEALNEDELRIKKIRQEMELVELIHELQHVVVMEFDTLEDYQKAVKHPFFQLTPERRWKQYGEVSFWRLPSGLAHKLWDHRYLPVEMKSKGPSMLVSETIIPIDKFKDYMDFIQSAITFWTNNPVKTEGHLINKDELLLQTIILADTSTFRHKMYLALVPFMTQAAIYFGGYPYGIGVWNLPFIKYLFKSGQNVKWHNIRKFKKEFDPDSIINQCKHVNRHGRKVMMRLFKKTTPLFLHSGVRLLHKGRIKNKNFSIYSLGRALWRISKIFIPKVIPPQLRVHRQNISSIISTCAECNSCESVCPTSDVFGLFGAATPVTRRKTAARLIQQKKISRKEALGFLACTRCDSCTRICPANVPLTQLFDIVESDARFTETLSLSDEEKKDFIDRFWKIMKDSPQFRKYTLSERKESHSHLEHGLRIVYSRGFPYANIFIDPETCIHCGMCSNENACTYGAREGSPRCMPQIQNENCALCNACINYCPQNKIIQKRRDYIAKLIFHSVDMEERRYWENQIEFVRDTTIVQRSGEITQMADVYLTEDIIMEIDKEASTGKIPVSGMGQGDRHMGIGFDAERFSHFHIVGPAQNRLHEGDPDDELSVILGKRHRYCKFDEKGNLNNPSFPEIKLMSPILYNAIPLDSNGKVELAFIKVAEKQKTLVVMDHLRFIEHYDFFIKEGGYKELPKVVIPRINKELINTLRIQPNLHRELLIDFWNMPAFEIVYSQDMDQTVQYVMDSIATISSKRPLLIGYVEVSENDIIGGVILPELKDKIDSFLSRNFDIIHIHGLRNRDNYFVTSNAVHAVHHYLLNLSKRHDFSIIASGGIRLASDTQKTIQRGAEATLIDFAALVALDPYSYKAVNEKQSTTEKLMNLDINWAVSRLNNQMESRKVQLLEVLGAAGFKDIKKTVGEEGRLIDFYNLEEKLQKQIFEKEDKIEIYKKLNTEVIENEPVKDGINYSELKTKIRKVKVPHNFYSLGKENQKVYQRDHVWPGWVIETIGKMASGDEDMVYLKNVKGTGLLGDGFDVMKILYQRDPDIIPENELNLVKTTLPHDKDLILNAPWMLAGKSVGSIGLDTWKAHVIVARELGIQYDTGEGGYPTCFFLNRKGEPIFFTEPDIQALRPYFEHNHYYTVKQIVDTAINSGITHQTNPQIFEVLSYYPEKQSFLFYVVVDKDDEKYVSTELKTGLFGVTKETIKKARRVVIAYSQGAKMGIGGHILSGKVNKLVAYLRGIRGLENLNNDKIESLMLTIKKIEKETGHPLGNVARESYSVFVKSQENQQIYPDLKDWLLKIQEQAYELNEKGQLDPIEFEHILRLIEDIIQYSYTSIISPFPFHNCYSIEDVKAFIDIVRMINPDAVISVKVSPSVDIEFIAAGLGRISKDNNEEALNQKIHEYNNKMSQLSVEVSKYAKKYGMKIEIWLDGPRGGTGASPNIIKGQMGMHIEYAIPLIHDRLVRDNLRNHVKFFVSGGIRTYEDVIKAIALGADGVIWGTAPLVSIGCDRNRNCHDGCSRGIATSNLIMQKLRDVNINSIQMINTFTIMQMQVIRALAALGLKDIRELRGRYDKILWIGLKERVDYRIRQRNEYKNYCEEIINRSVHQTGQSNCGVAAIIGTKPVPSYILDKTLNAMKNRGMDGVGVAKTLCFPESPDYYAYRIMVKGKLQIEIEDDIKIRDKENKIDENIIKQARKALLDYRYRLTEIIKKMFFDPYFIYSGNTDIIKARESYKTDDKGNECDFRQFGNSNTDPGDIFKFFVRVRPEILDGFIKNELLKSSRFVYVREYFPGITADNCHEDEKFIKKAEDIFVFNHSITLSRLLYVSDIRNDVWKDFILSYTTLKKYSSVLIEKDPISESNIDLYGEHYLYMLQEFIKKYPFADNQNKYTERARKIASVMSCGKNFAVWKTAGREIPWKTPDSPNNIIHVRLATGSIVEQMNAHPFAKLNTALTHNGETTNYEALKQRVEQFGLFPLATTDTEVASLKFHLIADELQYPDRTLFESFSPTTGEDFALIPEKLKQELHEVQRVEFTSSPDGPYQYLCLRHNQELKTTERVDLKDPADLRPNTTAFCIDKEKKYAFCIISSEEQAIQQMLELLDTEGLIDGAQSDEVMVSSGMISKFKFNDSGAITDYEFKDRYDNEIIPEDYGKHYSMTKTKLYESAQTQELAKEIDEYKEDKIEFIKNNVVAWNFNSFRGVLSHVASDTTDKNINNTFELFTHLLDYLRTMNTGDKAKSSLIDISRTIFYDLLDRVNKIGGDKFHRVTIDKPEVTENKNRDDVIVINCHGFGAEGTDPTKSLAALLSEAYSMGWRKFILYRVNGQRLISTSVMGKCSTDDVEMDVYGIPGEYFGAFMQGGKIRLHGNAQNFCAMGMHHGNLYIYGNAGKVCGYASKGGEVFILGNIVDRAWTNSVDDPRCQNLKIHILGSASKYAGESLMGGDFFFGGMYFDSRGNLKIQDRPYRGTKLLGGASRGNMLFFDPYDRMNKIQYSYGIKLEISDDDEWKKYEKMVEDTLVMAGVKVIVENNKKKFVSDGKEFEIVPDNFKLIVPKGGLKGYESH